MAFDPRWLAPDYYASLPLGGSAQYGMGAGGFTAFPSKIDQSQLKNLMSMAQGRPRGLLGGVFNPFTPDYIRKPPASISAGDGFGGDFGSDMFVQRPLSELSGYFDFSPSDPTFGKLSPTAQSYLNFSLGNSFAPIAKLPLNDPRFSPENVAAHFAPQDFQAIDAAIQPYRTAQQLYSTELLRKAQSGQIKVIEDKSGGLFGSLMSALPAIVGTAVGGPVGGAIGGAISGGLSGGGWKGALTGAVGGGIAGAGGLGSVLGKVSTGGSMNSITSGLSSIANSNLNPFNYLSGGIQGLFGTNPATMGLGSALSLGGPGALLGGALGGTQGALLGGLGGAGLGLGMDGYLGGLFGGGNPLNGLFGGGGATGGAAGGAGGGAGSAGLLGSLFGGSGGGLGGLLAGGIPLALLTNEANKATDTPVNMRTPFSSITNGAANMDPMIRNTLLESMGNTRGMLGKAQGNQNAFIQARVNPMEAQVARQRGQMEQSLGLRGVAGSSFGDQAMRSFNLDSERALGDARSQATQEALGFESGLNQLLSQGGSQLLAQELAALGLSGQNIEQLISRAKLRTDLFGRAASQFGSLLGG